MICKGKSSGEQAGKPRGTPRNLDSKCNGGSRQAFMYMDNVHIHSEKECFMVFTFMWKQTSTFIHTYSQPDWLF